MSDDLEIQFIFPAVSDDPLSDMLRLITQAIEEKTGEAGGWGLGGEHGYGAPWDTPVFTMRRFYWGDCDCGADERSDAWHKANHHTKDCFRTILHKRFAKYDRDSGWNAIHKELRAEKYYDRRQEETPFGTMYFSGRNAAGEAMHKKWCAALEARRDAHERLTNELYDEFGLPRSLYQWHCSCGVDEKAKTYFATEGHYATCAVELPNFRHHASGFEVRWYKYIGRDNETVNQPADLTPIFRDCLADIAASGMEAPSGGETAKTGSTEGDSPVRDSGDAQ